MTNAQIIDQNKAALAEAGILSYTGRYFEGIDGEGNQIQIPEVETIHTFEGWKKLGFSVKKGQHAVASFTIWVPCKPKKAPDSIDPNSETGKFLRMAEKAEEDHPDMRMRKAFWFTAAQVEPLKH